MARCPNRRWFQSLPVSAGGLAAISFVAVAGLGPESRVMGAPETVLGPGPSTGFFSSVLLSVDERVNDRLTLTLGDFDGDSDLDFATSRRFGPVFGVQIWVNLGHDQGGTEGTFVDGLFVEDLGHWDLQSGDLDGDGDVDIFVSVPHFNGLGQGSVVLINQGGDQGGVEGFFLRGPLFDQNALAVLGDLDRDNPDFDLDALVLTSQGWTLLINQGDGTFVPGGQLFGSSTARFNFPAAVGDIDADGDLDFLIPTDFGSEVWVNQGAAQGGVEGVFAPHATPMAGCRGRLALGDFDLDSDLDLFHATKYGDPFGPEGGNAGWINDGVGSFSWLGAVGADQHVTGSVAIGDLDGDGNLDAMTSRLDPVRVAVWLGQGDATFEHSGQCILDYRLDGDTRNSRLRLGDLDGDSALDAVVMVADLRKLHPGVEDRVGLYLLFNGADPALFRTCCSAEAASLNAPIPYHPTCHTPSRENGWGMGEALGRLGHRLAEAALGVGVQGSIDLGSLHWLRDSLLPASPNGQPYVDFYDAHNVEILSLLVLDPALRQEGAQTLALWSPNIEALRNGQGEQTVITQLQVDAIDGFLTDLSAAGSPALSAAIANELAVNPPLQDLVGETMHEAQEMTSGLLGGLDYGDAPEPLYPTLLANDGARHELAGSGPLLGALADEDLDGHASPAARGDDEDGSDDEDGVQFDSVFLVPGSTMDLSVQATAAGWLNAWVDFDRDGSWLGAGEQVFADEPVGPGSNPLSFAVPVGATSGPTYLRFRLDSLGGLAPSGPALDGEVEDYQLNIGAPIFFDGFETGDTTRWSAAVP